jgi:hypothetical protein
MVADAVQTIRANHPIGPGGQLRVSCARGSIVVRGVDGDECRVEARYRLAGPSSLIGGDPERIVRVSRDDDRVTVEVREGSPLAVEIGIDVPRSASVTVGTVSADVELHGLRGVTRIEQVSGKARLFGIAGQLDIETISGPVAVEGGDVGLKASTASGAISVDVERIDDLELTTLSGDVSLAGGLRAEGHFRIESVSGDIRLATPSGFTAMFRSLSGRVLSEGGVADQARRGEHIVRVGDGRAPVQVRTVSGKLRLTGADRPAQSVEPPVAPVPPEPPTRPTPAVAAEQAAVSVDDSLATLLALERGEIDVDEAARRLGGMSRG